MGKSNNIIEAIISEIFMGKVIQESEFTSKIFTTFIFIGLLTHLIFNNVYSNLGTYGPATALVWGYTLIFFSMVIIVYLNSLQKYETNFFKMVDIETVILMFYILWLISLNMNHSKKINSNSMPRNFYSYSYNVKDEEPLIFTISSNSITN